MQRVKLECHWIQTLQHFHNPYISHGGWRSAQWSGNEQLTWVAKLCSGSPGACLRPVGPTQAHWAAHLDFHSSWTPGSTPVSHPKLTTQPSTEGREPQVCSGQCQGNQCHWSSTAAFNTSLSPASEGRHGQKQNMRAHHRNSSTPLCAWGPVWCVCTKKSLLWPKSGTCATTGSEG